MSGHNGYQNIENHPAAMNMAAHMTVDILANKSGRAAVLHDRPLPAKLQWAELDVETATLTFPTEDGAIIDFGMKICPQVLTNLRHAARIQVVQLRGGQVYDIYDLALLVSGETVN